METQPPINWDSNDIPLRQVEDIIPLTTLRQEGTNAEPARLAVIAGSVRGSNRVAHDILAGRGCRKLGLGAEAAGDDHARDGARRGAAEVAGGAVGGAGEAQGRTERSEGWHCDVVFAGVVSSGWMGLAFRGPGG